MFLHVTSVSYLDDYKLVLKFNHGAEGIVDLKAELYGEIFEPLRDKELFKKVFLTSRTIEWPNGADFAPEFLFEIAQLSKQPILSFTPKHDIMELHGLGADIWQGIDAQEYVNNLREEWD